jgi:hypothetical protein
MATTTIKCWLDFTNGVATVALNSGNSGNAGVSLAAPNVIEDMWLIAMGTVNAVRVVKGSLSTTQIELQENWNGSTVANVECRISTSGSSVANLTAAVRALISSSTSIQDHLDDAVGAHAASAIANTPAGGISATTVQAALNELDTEKFAKTGGNITGNVGVNVSPSAWHANYRSVDNQEWGGYYCSSGGFVGLAANAYNDGAWKYKGGTTALRYEQTLGSTPSTTWDRAVSGSAGAAITWVTDMKLTHTGNLIIGGTGVGNTARTRIVTTDSTQFGLEINLDNASATGVGLLISQGNAAGTTHKLISGHSGIFGSTAVERFAVFNNGNVVNSNNSYGSLSDANLKRDVTDTGPKLSKVLAMRVVNYFLKADTTNTKLLGLIAQELRAISPGLVDELPDFEMVEVEPARTDTITKQRQKTVARTFDRPAVVMRDGVAVRVMESVTEDVPLWVDIPLFGEDGQRIVDVMDGKQVPAVHREPVMEDYTETVEVPAKIESRPTGTTTLSIKYSVLVPMLVKAMQEMHADFDGRLKAIGA